MNTRGKKLNVSAEFKTMQKGVQSNSGPMILCFSLRFLRAELRKFLVVTNFFCLNFGRDQKLGEENEKGYVDQTFKFQFQWADKNYRRLLRMSGAGGKEKDKVEKVGSDFHRKILGGSDTNENISLAQFSVLVLFHSVRGGPLLSPLHKFSSFFEGFFSSRSK